MRKALSLSVLLALAPALSPAAAGEGAYLVRDLTRDANLYPGSYNPLGPRQMVTVGRRVFFLADEPDLGARVWTTDGTIGGTQPLGEGPSDYTFLDILGSVRGVLLWSGPQGEDEERVSRLWRSDGTLGGTRVLAPAALTVAPDSGGAVLGSFLYFVGCSAPARCELWRSDGTDAGTEIVQDAALPTPYGPFHWSLLAGKLYFTAGSALLATDGTAAGTSLVLDLGEGEQITACVAAADKLFLATANELWTSDGTAAGTRKLHSFTAGYGPRLRWLKPFGGHVDFLAASGAGDAAQLWQSDGTAAGTQPMTALRGDDPFYNAQPESLEEVGGRAVFFHLDEYDRRVLSSSSGTPGSTTLLAFLGGYDLTETVLVRAGGQLVFDFGSGLWSTDGTHAGTVPIVAGAHHPRPLAGMAIAATSDGQLWQTDGTAAGSRRLARSSLSAGGSAPLEAAALGGRIVFGVAYPYAEPLQATDDSRAGSHVLSLPLHRNPYDAPRQLVAAGDRLFFNYFFGDSVPGDEWVSRGDAESTVELPAGPSDETLPTAVGSALFLASDGPTLSGNQILSRTDGTAAGTGVVADLGDDGSRIAAMVAFRGELYFSLAGERASQIWKSDGTAAGTGPAFDLPAEATFLDSLTAVGDELYFLSGGLVWRSDGTSAGTRSLRPFGADRNVSSPEFTRVGAAVYFVAGDPLTGTEVWKTDGTAAGTVLVADVEPGDVGSSPSGLTELGGKLYFFASFRSGTVRRRGLWRSDGTPDGTVLLADFPDSSSSSYPMVAGGLLFFVADDGVHGRELWKSDGTAQGTAMVRDVFPGAPGAFSLSYPGPSLAAAGGRLYFAADDGVHGQELWQSDGTEAGTRLVQDVVPGSVGSGPEQLTVAGDRLYFTAYDETHGRQLWALPLGAAGCRPAADHLCLQNGRFEVRAEWRDFQGNTGQGTAAPLSADTGTFWFFSPSNVEVVVKVLDGRGVNQAFWVFYGALSSVEYTLSVTDTETGLTRRYFNPAGTLASVGDTDGFGPLGASSTDRPKTVAKGLTLVSARTDPRAATRSCTADAGRLCLAGGRFALTAAWKDFQGHAGSGTAVGLTGDTGYFWFFDSGNVEVVAKVLDGQAVNGKFWLFYGALSSVEYTLTVTDTQTGAVKMYRNASGNLASVADTSAF